MGWGVPCRMGDIVTTARLPVPEMDTHTHSDKIDRQHTYIHRYTYTHVYTQTTHIFIYTYIYTQI